MSNGSQPTPNRETKPNISPLSLSVWQNPDNLNQWCWSVHKGMKAVSKGYSLEPTEAIRQAKLAFEQVR